MRSQATWWLQQQIWVLSLPAPTVHGDHKQAGEMEVCTSKEMEAWKSRNSQVPCQNPEQV